MLYVVGEGRAGQDPIGRLVAARRCKRAWLLYRGGEEASLRRRAGKIAEGLDLRD